MTIPEKIEDLELSVRAANRLQEAGIVLVADLLTRTPQSLLKIRGFGIKSYREILSLLDEMGLKMKDEPKTP